MDVAVISTSTTRTRYLDARCGGRGRTAPFSAAAKDAPPNPRPTGNYLEIMHGTMRCAAPWATVKKSANSLVDMSVPDAINVEVPPTVSSGSVGGLRGTQVLGNIAGD